MYMILCVCLMLSFRGAHADFSLIEGKLTDQAAGYLLGGV